MGRLRYKIGLIVISCTLLLSGCYSKPGDIDTGLSYIDKVVGGDPVGGETQTGDGYGYDSYTYDENGSQVTIHYPPTNDTDINLEDEFAAIAEQAAKTQTSSSASTSAAEPVVAPLVVTYENVHTLSEGQLSAYYGNKNTRGYCKSDGSFYDVGNDCIGSCINMSYADAVTQYSSMYGAPDLVFDNFTYWFEDDFAYCLCQDSYYTVFSQSTYKNIGCDEEGTQREFITQIGNTPSIVADAYATYGNTYHYDYYNYIYDTPTGWLIINRESYATYVI